MVSTFGLLALSLIMHDPRLPTTPILERLREYGCPISREPDGGLRVTFNELGDLAACSELVRREPQIVDLMYYNALEDFYDDAFLPLAGHPKLKAMRLGGKRLTWKVTELLPTLPKLEIVELDMSGNGDRACELLARCTGLRELHFSCDELSPTAVARLAALTRLERLYLPGTPLTSEGLEFVGDLKQLKRTNFVRTQIDDRACSFLAKATTLKWLDLAETAITDGGVHHFRALTNLEFMSLRKTQVTAAGLRGLSVFPKLDTLNIAGIRQSEASIDWICRQPKLTSVSFYKRDVTPAQRARLERSLPQYAVSFIGPDAAE